MPCYRCGTRQVDPDRGESPWKRGVRGDRQVLICPACQVAHDWTADLDHCPVCSSVKLVRRLGEAECRDCGSVRPPAASALPGHLAVLARVSHGVAGGGASGADGSGASATATGPDGPADPGPMQELAAEVEQALARVLGRTAGSAAGG